MSNQEQFSSSCGDNGNSESLLIENSPLKKAKIEIECEDIDNIDRINQLPEALIVQILSRLCITDAFRTTILSKYWQYFWTCIDNIVYEEDYSRSNSSTMHKFISLTDNVLPLLICSTIKNFSLNFVFRYDDDVSYFPKIDKWLEFAVNKTVEDLHLNIRYTVDPTEHDQPYSLPVALSNSSSILKLNCKNCRILEDCVLNWTSLRSLTLKNLFLRDEHIKQIMSNCPQLESLKLQEFCGFNRLHMTSPKCRRLHLIHHGHPCGDWYSFEGDICCFEIVAPHVEHLTISGVFNHTKIKLRDLSSLKHANLDLVCDEFNEMDKHIVKDLLVSVRCANELILSSWFIKVISNLMLEEENVFSPLLECRWLTISSCISKLSFPLLDNLLRSTRKLENLMIFPDTPYHPFFEDEDLDLVEDKYLSFEENIFKVSLQNLKNVKVMPFCSRTRRSDETELNQFLKFLLEHAINLEKLVIVPEHKECNNCSTNTSYLKYLLAFPTTSIRAVISLGKASQNVFYSDV
ncbi:F-box protein At5g03100-like [Solanum stenotomum]|uniref:F-box protein At5g03100-like n=1 Tax=Solanum stenotomum TaxID=172797 RepID=UPI0020D12E5D|nr:F-box protein At5g03100-like [Solanum stenotomum]